MEEKILKKMDYPSSIKKSPMKSFLDYVDFNELATNVGTAGAGLTAKNNANKIEALENATPKPPTDGYKFM